MPHPEERRLRRVSKDETHTGASWFETAQVRLLTMRDMISCGGNVLKTSAFIHELVSIRR